MSHSTDQVETPNGSFKRITATNNAKRNKLTGTVMLHNKVESSQQEEINRKVEIQNPSFSFGSTLLASVLRHTLERLERSWTGYDYSSVFITRETWGITLFG